MRTKALLPAAILAALPSLFACASAPAAPTARSIIDGYVQATHTDRLVAETDSMHVSGEIQAGGVSGTLDVYSAKPDKQLVRTELMGSGVEGYDGEIAWNSHPMMGTHLLDGVDLFARKMRAGYDAALMKPADFDSIVLDGVEDFEGRPCHKITMIYRAPDDPEFAEQTLAVRTSENFFDVETGLLSGTKTTAPTPLGEIPTTSVIDEYGTFDGYVMPVHMTQKAMGQEISIVLDSFDANDVDPSTFDRPEAVKTLLANPEGQP